MYLAGLAGKLGVDSIAACEDGCDRKEPVHSLP